MSEVTPLTVTLELPASELLENEGALLVRCPLNGVWVPLTDYYSEQEGSLLPLVGKVNFAEAPDHWVDTGKTKPILDSAGNVIGEEPIMEKQAKGSAVTWNEVVRILAPVEQAAPEGGTVEINAEENVAMTEKGPGNAE
jgi:hypothetical protein